MLCFVIVVDRYEYEFIMARKLVQV